MITGTSDNLNLYIDIEKARVGLVPKKVYVTRGNQSYMATVYINPNKEHAVEQYSDLEISVKKELENIASIPAENFKEVKGKINQDMIENIAENMRTQITAYSKYLAGDTANLLNSYVRDSEKLLEKGLDEFKDFNSRHVDLMFKNNIEKLMYQEIESNRKQYTDHGIRHIVKNIETQSKMLDVLEEQGEKITKKDRLLANFAMVNHDVGYTVAEVRQPGMEGIKASGKHKEFSADIAELQSDRWNKDKIFSREEYKRAVDMIRTHDSSEISKDLITTTMRIADNLALFQKEKLPSIFQYIDYGKDQLIKMGEAAKSDNKVEFDFQRNGLYTAIDKTEKLSTNLKRDLKAAVQDINFMTPKFTLGILAGEVKNISSTKESAVKVKIKHNEMDAFLQQHFEMGQKQLRKVLGDYGITDFTQKKYKIGKWKNKTMLEIEVED